MQVLAARSWLQTLIVWSILHLSSAKTALTCQENTKLSAEEYVTLGANAFEKNDLDNAAKCFKLATKAKNATPHVSSIALTNLATVLNLKGDVDGAYSAFAHAAKVVPTDAEVHYLWGKFLVDGADEEKRAEGKRLLEQCWRLDPSHARAQTQLGVELQKDGKLQEAVEHYQLAVKADPTQLPARVQEAIALAVLKRCKKATKKAGELASTPHIEAKLLRGLTYVFEQCGDHQRHKAMLAREIEQAPQGVAGADGSSFHFQYATVLLKEHRFLPAIAHLEKALEVEGHVGAVYSYLGFCYTELGGQHFNRALHAFHRSAVAYGLLQDDGSVGAGVAALGSSRTLDEAAGAFANLVRLKYVTANWTRIDAHLSVLRDLVEASLRNRLRAPVNPVFALAYPIPDALVARIAMSFARWNDLHLGAAAEPPRWIADAPSTSRRIRVGFLSSAFNDNGVGRHLERWRFWPLCAASAAVECFILSTGESNVASRPLSTLSAVLGAGNVLALPPGTGASTHGEAIAGLRLHWLLDLNGYTQGERPELVNPAGRSAALQALFYGYEGTYGHSSAFDYLLSDAATAAPELTGPLPSLENGELGSGAWAEKLLLVPGCKFPSGDLLLPSEEAAAAEEEGGAAELFEREVLGQVPAAQRGETFVFCNFAKYFKIQPEMFRAWVRILLRVPGSVLWILGYRKDGAREAVPQLRREAEAMGLAPERIVATPLLERETHIAVKAFAHLLLDTSPYNGHLTAAEALWAGVPVLTLPRARLPSRVSCAMLKSLGVDHTLVARTLADYEDVAVALAGSWRGGGGRHRRRAGRSGVGYHAVREQIATMRQLRRGFFDTQRWASSFAAAARTAWDLHMEVGWHGSTSYGDRDTDTKPDTGTEQAKSRRHVIIADRAAER